MRKTTELLKKMTKAMNFCKAYKEDFELDLKWLSDEHIGYTDYLWIVKESGTELMPLLTAVAKGCFDNSKAHNLAERNVRGYLIKVSSREAGAVDGAMTGIRDLKRFLSDNEKTPAAISMNFVLTNGKTEKISTGWHPDYHDILLKMLEAAPEDVDHAYVAEVIY